MKSGLAFCLYTENHRLCRWFQKALAMRRKNILLWYNDGGLPTAIITKGGIKSR